VKCKTQIILFGVIASEKLVNLRIVNGRQIAHKYKQLLAIAEPEIDAITEETH
jgi:hypothetical protein